jgi:pimeloyl-ACP methyl ester carboxylesterase
MTRTAGSPVHALLLTLALGVVLLLEGCATPRSAPLSPGSMAAAPGAELQRPMTLDPALERQILALDPDHISERDVRTTLALGPTPRVILLHGGLYGTHLLMMNFGKFLIGMGYPDAKIRDPSDGAYSQSPFGSTERLAGEIAWYYEHDGLRPLLVGHSQGGIQAVKVLYELDGAFAKKIAVWNPTNDTPEERFSIVDPLTGETRSVVGLTVAYASVVGAGGVALASPVHWGMAQRLHEIPNTVDDFTAFNIDFDMVAWTLPGAAPFRHNGTAQVRNVSLPATYNHIFVPLTQALASDPQMRDWINAYVPGADNGKPPGSEEGRGTNAYWAADVWFSIKKHWCLEAQRLIRAKQAAPAAH